MSAVILDASALLALLLDEPGAAKVQQVIAQARMSSFNHAEIVRHFIKAGMPPGEVEAMLRPLPLTVIEADGPLAILAERMRTATAGIGLSPGACHCLALARRDGLTALTADRQWRAIADSVDVAISVIR